MDLGKQTSIMTHRGPVIGPALSTRNGLFNLPGGQRRWYIGPRQRYRQFGVRFRAAD